MKVVGRCFEVLTRKPPQKTVHDNNNKLLFKKNMSGRNLKIIISIFYYIFWQFGVFMRRLFTGQSSAKFVILTYHSVYDDERENFRKQMDIVRKTGHTIFPDGTRYKEDVRHHIAVTFDDGYLNVIENAIPILEDRDIPATIFVTTGKLGQKPDWMLDENNRDSNETIVTAQKLLELDESRLMLGSHTVTHKNLAEMDESTIRYELIESKQNLEVLLGHNVPLLAFPFGAYNQRVLSIAWDAGYKHVFSNIPDSRTQRMNSEGDDLFLRGRTPVTPLDGMLEFYLKCSGAYQWLPVAINLKRKMKFLVSEVFTIFRTSK